MYGKVKPLRGAAEAKASLKWAIESYVSNSQDHYAIGTLSLVSEDIEL